MLQTGQNKTAQNFLVFNYNQGRPVLSHRYAAVHKEEVVDGQAVFLGIEGVLQGGLALPGSQEPAASRQPAEQKVKLMLLKSERSL